MSGFAVLFVCVGNVCRSPFGERLLALRLAERGAGDRFPVASSGVRALIGEPMHPTSSADLTSLGGSSAGFLARQFDESHAERAGLVLTATRDVRSRVLQEAPAALRRTFTIVEFAALAEAAASDPAPVAAELVRDCGLRRSSVSTLDLDVGDPIGQDAAVFAAVAGELDRAVTRIADVLARTV